MSLPRLRIRPRTHTLSDLLGFVAVSALIRAAAGSASRRLGPGGGLAMSGVALVGHLLIPFLFWATRGLGSDGFDTLNAILSLMDYMNISCGVLIILAIAMLLDTTGGVLVGLSLAAAVVYRVSWLGSDP